MIVAFWAAVGKVALKMLQFLVGDKKGRKFLGYVIGIALFIVLLPVIAIYGLFGWMSGGEVAEIVGYDAIYQNLPTEIREQIDENEIQLDAIETVFRENGLASGDISKAKLIYLSYLTDRFSEGNFYQRLADCFLTVSQESDLLTNISSAFGIEFNFAYATFYKSDLFNCRITNSCYEGTRFVGTSTKDQYIDTDSTMTNEEWTHPIEGQVMQ